MGGGTLTSQDREGWPQLGSYAVPPTCPGCPTVVLAQPRVRDLSSGQASVAHSTIAFSVLLSPGTQREEEGTCREASSSHCQRQPPDEAVVTHRLFLSKDPGDRHCGRPPSLRRQGPSLTSGKRAGQQGSVPLWHGSCGRKVQVVSLCCTFLGRGAGPLCWATG